MKWWLLAVASFAAIPSFALADDDRPVGLVTLRSEGISSPAAALVNEQLSGTLKAISLRKIVPVTLPEGAVADDIEALRSAGALGDLYAVVGGFVSAVDDPGVVKLVWVPADGALPRVISRPVPQNALEAQAAAVDAAACAIVGSDGETASCQVPVELLGNVNSAELDIDGRRVMRVADVAGISIDVGSHIARGCLGDDCSTKRRLDLMRNSSLMLRVQRECNRMHLLGLNETPDCGGTPTTEVIPLVIESDPPNWKGIVALAAGGAALVVGTIFAVQASSAKADYASRSKAGTATEEELSGILEDGRTASSAAAGLLIGGAVVSAAGGVVIAFDF